MSITPKSPTITFFDQHKPTLRDGAYQVEVSQKMKIKKDATLTPATQPSTQNIEFHIAGPKFAIEPSLVHSVYPPKGGKADYRADLPTLTLNRSTLPWERKPTLAAMGENSASWLFLLMLDENDQKNISEYNNALLSSVNTTYSLGIAPDELKILPEKINHITMDGSMTWILPSTIADLEYLSYARIKDGGEEQAVILCNRLPTAGSNITMYLVSLENLYSEATPPTLNAVAPGSNYFLPYLYKWTFNCFEDQLYCITEDTASKVKSANTTITQALTSLNMDPPCLIAPFQTAITGLGIVAGSAEETTLLKAGKLPGSTFHELLSNLHGGFTPLSLSPQATDVTSVGTLNLPYNNITPGPNGYLPSPSNSWFRGPLVGGTFSLGTLASKIPTTTSTTLPLHPDELIITDGSGQAVELTYAAAFELGRLIALDDVAFATAYYEWKNQAAIAVRLTQAANPGDTVLAAAQATTAPDMPQIVLNKITAWKSLEGIPYRYLIPDPALLPNESIRFFYLDKNWINVFLSGAFSIGQTLKADLVPMLSPYFMDTTWQQMGVLVNSLAVSGWPNFEVTVTPVTGDSYTDTHKTSNNLDVNIAMFQTPQEFKQLDFHLHHGKVHTGFLLENGNYEKLDPTTGTALLSTAIPTIASASLPLASAHRVINATNIASTLGATTVTEFAFKMLEGKAEVRFTIT